MPIALALGALLGVLMAPIASAIAQEHPGEDHGAGVGHKRQKFAFYQGTSWIPEGRNPETGARQTVLAPSYGVVYEYWFDNRFALGTYNDIKLMNLQVEHEAGELVKRESAVVFTGALVWAPREPWTLSIGPGIEVEHHESVWLARAGAEYAFPLPKDWELSLGASYEFKDYYDSWGLGLTIGRRFGSRLPGVHHAARPAMGR